MTRELVVGPNYVNSRLLFLLLSIFGPFLSFDEMQAGVDGFKRERGHLWWNGQWWQQD